MLTTPRLVAIAALRGTQFRDRQHRLSVKLPIYLDSIGTILCALLIFPDRLPAISFAFLAGFIGGGLDRVFIKPFLPWVIFSVLAGRLLSTTLTGSGTETFRRAPVGPLPF